jgi:hypothetical protein
VKAIVDKLEDLRSYSEQVDIDLRKAETDAVPDCEHARTQRTARAKEKRTRSANVRVRSAQRTERVERVERVLSKVQTCERAKTS